MLRLPDGTGTRLKVRSLVGLLPICATSVIEADVIERYPHVAAQVAVFLERNRDLLANIADPLVPGVNGRRILSLVNEEKLRRILARMLDEERFLGPHGIRSISRWHLEHPYTFDVHGVGHRVQYEPAESTSGMFGGNSNWRGPVWFPVSLPRRHHGARSPRRERASRTCLTGVPGSRPAGRAGGIPVRCRG